MALPPVAIMRYSKLLVPAAFALLDVAQALPRPSIAKRGDCDSIGNDISIPDGTPDDCCRYYVPTEFDLLGNIFCELMAEVSDTEATMDEILAFNPILDGDCGNLVPGNA